MQYRLRTLLILLAVGPMVLAGAWWTASRWYHPRFDVEALTGPWPETELQLYAYQNEIQQLSKEINNRGNINQADMRGWTALHWSVAGESYEATQLLLQSGASPHAQDSFGFSPGDYAKDDRTRALIATSRDQPPTLPK